MIEVIHVSSRGQIVIPTRVRKQLGIKAGSKLILLEKEGDILLNKEEKVTQKLEESKETIGWMKVAEQSLKELWDNPKDEENWKKYI